MRLSPFFLGAALVLTPVVAAHADTLQFTFSAMSPLTPAADLDLGTVTMSSTPLPIGSSSVNPGLFEIGYAVVVPTTSTNSSLSVLSFLTYGSDGGFTDDNPSPNQYGFYGFVGPQVFTDGACGTTACPVFAPGTYYFADANFLPNGTTEISEPTVEELTITDLTPIDNGPEPSSLILLGTGALGLAGAVRRRVRK